MTMMENLLAEVDLLREELEGLYREKHDVDQYVKVLLEGTRELKDQLDEARQEASELLLSIRRVDSLYGPFEEFDPWPKEETGRQLKAARHL